MHSLISTFCPWLYLAKIYDIENLQIYNEFKNANTADLSFADKLS
ncbi:hypothetical protein PSMA106859_05225 [Pseudoalteromonas maricaloris]